MKDKDFKEERIILNQKNKLIKMENKILNKTLIITESEFLIRSLSLPTGKYQWELNLEQEISNYQVDGIQKIIGVYKDVLWLSCTKALWGIDINTGENLMTMDVGVEVWSVDLTSNARTILIGCADGTVRMLSETAKGKLPKKGGK